MRGLRSWAVVAGMVLWRRSVRGWRQRRADGSRYCPSSRHQASSSHIIGSTRTAVGWQVRLTGSRRLKPRSARRLVNEPHAGHSLLHTSPISTGLVPVGSQLVRYGSSKNRSSHRSQARRRAGNIVDRDAVHGTGCSLPVVTSTGTSPVEA